MTLRSTFFTKPLSRAAALPNSALRIRGGTAVTANNLPFDLDLAKIRLEGLSYYGTVTALIIAANLTMMGYIDSKPIPIPENSSQHERDLVKFNNILKVCFGLCMDLSIACGIYTTIVFTLMDIYGKTSLGLGINDAFVEFFSACSRYRQYAYFSFLATLISFNAGWLISVILGHEGKMRWRMSAPVCFVGVVSLFHYRDILILARNHIFQNL
jgi:hypothetical protein